MVLGFPRGWYLRLGWMVAASHARWFPTCKNDTLRGADPADAAVCYKRVGDPPDPAEHNGKETTALGRVTIEATIETPRDLQGGNASGSPPIRCDG
jgi:hypothetical protein